MCFQFLDFNLFWKNRLTGTVFFWVKGHKTEYVGTLVKDLKK